MKKKLKYTLFVLVGLILVGEIGLRLVGFGNPPLYVASDAYEYIYAPNQDLNRYGNHILTNSVSMRSAPIQEQDKVKVLLFGDSIIHGGAKTDHDSLAATRLEKRYQSEFGSQARVLNVSCGSWGPDNAYAYLLEKGDFDAERFVVVFSSHDYADFMNFRPIVGNLRSYPDTRPWTAIGEVLNRFLLPRITGRWMKDPNVKPKIHREDTGEMNPGWEGFRSYCESHDIPLLMVLHPTTKEVKAGAFNERGQAMKTWFHTHEIPYIDELEAGTKAAYYRDDIHYNDDGQRFLAETLAKNLLN